MTGVQTAIVTILVAAAAVVPARGQTLGSIDVLVDGGVLGDGPVVARASDTHTAQVTWFGGVTAETPRIPLGRAWDVSAGAALRREPAFAMARAGTTVTPAYLDALTASTSLLFAHTSGSLETAIVDASPKRGSIASSASSARTTRSATGRSSSMWSSTCDGTDRVAVARSKAAAR